MVEELVLILKTRAKMERGFAQKLTSGRHRGRGEGGGGHIKIVGGGGFPGPLSEFYVRRQWT